MNTSVVANKVAFIGCGNIAHVHKRFVSKAGYTVEAVCDASQVRADIFADKYAISKRFTDIDTLLSHEKPDIVHILTPPHTHYALIIKSLTAGCHVLVEKPLCQTLVEYRDIMQLATEKRLLVSVDHTRVYNPMIVQARTIVQSGKIGRIVRMEYSYDDPSLTKLDSVANGFRWARGVPAWFEKVRGGILTDLLPHPLSVFLSFDKDLLITHVQSHSIRGEVIDELAVMLQSRNMDAGIHLSLNQKPLKNIFCIYGEKGSIRIDLRNMFSVCHYERRLPGIVGRVVIALSESVQILKNFSVNVVNLVVGHAHTYDGLDKIIGDFYEAVHAGKYNELPLINAGRVTSLIDEILEISLNNEATVKTVHVEPEPLPGPADYLVFGATGFIGRAIISHLVADHKSTRAFCRPSRNTDCLPASVGLVFGDLRNPVSIAASLAGVKTVVHCAAAMSGDWAEFQESTVAGTKNLLTSLTGSSVTQLIYISSLGVLDYNKLKNGSNVDESAPVEAKPDDRGFYTRAKVEAEKLVLEFAAGNPGVKVIILRPGLVYGCDSNNNLQNCGVMLDRFLFVFGLGRRGLGLNYVENLAQAVLLAGDADLTSGSIVQIVDPEQPTVRDIIKEHNKLSVHKVVPIFIPIVIWKTLFMLVDLLMYFKNKKVGTFSYRFASNSKKLHFRSDFAQRMLEWFPRYNFEESFSRTYFRR